MKLHEEFQVDQPPEAIWKFFEQPELVSACIPGIENVRVIDDDNVSVRATQSIGPMSATFDAKVTVLERVPNELIRFQAVGKSVRGAIGNVRATNAVRLVASGGATIVIVDGDVALAGALGSVGQKVVAKQAGKVTSQFAHNLERSLNGEPGGTQEAAAPVGGGALGALDEHEPLGALGAGGAPVGNGDGGKLAAPVVSVGTELWIRAAAVFSALSAALSAVTLIRQLRKPRR